MRVGQDCRSSKALALALAAATCRPLTIHDTEVLVQLSVVSTPTANSRELSRSTLLKIARSGGYRPTGVAAVAMLHRDSSTRLATLNRSDDLIMDETLVASAGRASGAEWNIEDRHD